MRLNSDRSRSSPQYYKFSHWLDISILACCLIFVFSGYGYAVTEPEMIGLRALPGALLMGQSSGVGAPATPLSVTGVAQGNPQLNLSPNSLSFGNVIVGSKATLPVTVTSTGTAPLTINSTTTSNAEFTVSGATFPITLKPKQTMTLYLTFASAEVSTIEGTLIVNSNAVRHERMAISLTSTGVAQPNPQLAVSASSLSFGDVAVGSTATLPVTLTSTGTTPLAINSQRINGTGFTVSGATFPLTLNPKQAVTLQVTYAPKAASAATGTLTISSNAARHGAIAVSLISQGGAAQLTLNATTLSFGTVNDGYSATLPLTLTSTGMAPLTINSARISGTGFTMSGAAFPVTLIPPLGITLQVQFGPTTGAPAIGAVTISSDDSTNPSTVVVLSGSGQYLVNLHWAAPVNSPNPVASYDVFRSTGASSSYQLLISLSDDQTICVDTSVQAGTTYNYYVVSVGRSGAQSGPSNKVTVSIPQEPDSVPGPVP